MSDPHKVPSGSGGSWASVLGGNLTSRNDGNVMEIVLEKESKGLFSASDEEVAKVLMKLGADLRPGVHIEGVQICPMGRNVIQVTLNKNVDMTRFCNKDIFEIRDGVRVSQVRKSGKREVIVTIRGLHPNTKDESVFRYLRCLGKVEKHKVILETYREGPLTGLKNGTRKYTVDMRNDIPVGNTHFIDGSKVNLSYPGQKKFCYRCFKISYECIGNGVAKDCEAKGSTKVLFSDHILDFWKKIQYSPDDKTALDDLEYENDVEVQVGGTFTPKPDKEKIESTIERKSDYGGVIVKWFPKKSDHGEIRMFLTGLGLSPSHTNVNIKDNGQVLIGDLEPETCQQLAFSITGQKFLNKKTIYCHPIVSATPEKNPLPASATLPSSTSPAPSRSSTPPPSVPSVSLDLTSAPGSTQPGLVTKDSKLKPKDVEESQPLESQFAFSPRPKSKLLDGSSSDSDLDDLNIYSARLDASDKWLTMNENKRQKKSKRKQMETSPESLNFKKQDKKSTPKSRRN